MSRLKREGNPPSGQLASPVPQAWDPVIEDYARITGQNLGNSRFGADSLQWGKTSDGLYVPIKVDSEGRQEVTLSGTFVRLSTEPKPTGREGDSLLLWDTKQVFVHDGTDWREW